MRYNPQVVRVEAMLDAIDAVGFEGRVFEPVESSEKPTVVQLEMAALPSQLKHAFDRATAEARLVLIDIHGPG